MHNLLSFSAYSIKVYVLSAKQFYQIATPRSHTVGNGRTRLHTVGHHRTRSDVIEHHRTDILRENRRTRSNTVVHASTYDRTRSHKIYF